MITISEYTGGIREWGDMISKCANCGEIVMRQECNSDGIPVRTIFDNTENHVCKTEENKNDNGTI